MPNGTEDMGSPHAIAASQERRIAALERELEFLRHYIGDIQNRLLLLERRLHEAAYLR